MIHKIARDATRGAVGCPVGVQVVGRHYQEEVVLHVMEVIEGLVNTGNLPLYTDTILNCTNNPTFFTRL